MLNKIPIYAPSTKHAALLAATMNLRLRQWEYAGESEYGRHDTWANVGDVLDSIEEVD